jgi:hypothetical protein
MEPVRVIVYAEENSVPKRYAAGYVLSDAEWVTIATKQRSSSHARDLAAEIVRGIEWELSAPKTPFTDEGQGWVDRSIARNRPCMKPSRNS